MERSYTKVLCGRCGKDLGGYLVDYTYNMRGLDWDAIQAINKHYLARHPSDPRQDVTIQLSFDRESVATADLRA